MTSRSPGRAGDDRLDAIFHALADRTRRAMLARLALGPAMVTELAAPFEMTRPAAAKHLRVLESAGLVDRDVQGRVHRCSFAPESLRAVEHWLTHYRAYWSASLDALADYAEAVSSKPARHRRRIPR